MAIKAVNLSDLRLSITGDDENPSIFITKPLGQFQYMRIAGVCQTSLGSLNDEDESDEVRGNKIVKIFATDKGIILKDELYSFFHSNIKEVRNFIVDGKPKDLRGDELKVELFRIMDLFDLMMQAVSMVEPSEEEKGN